MTKLSQKLKSLPIKPGVYIYKDKTGVVLYVGKAKSLKSRVRSYFSGSHDLEPKTQKLVSLIYDLEYILTDTEVEALMLENNLIKRYQPRYNIMLRDDKNYQFIKIDYSEQIPQIYTTRKIGSSIRHSERSKESSPLKQADKDPSLSLRMTKKNRPRYFGPYSSGLAVRQTLRLIRYIFNYCANKKVGTRPCFYYHLGRCPGVCVGKISVEEYRQHLHRVEKFLRGDLKKTIVELKAEMLASSKSRRYERAGRYRDQIAALTSILEKQKIVSPRRETHDAVGLFVAGSLAAATVFQIREGRLIGTQNFLLDNAKDSSGREILESFMAKYYVEATDVPYEINTGNESGAELQQLLSKHHNKKIVISSPTRGRKRQLIKLAETNAREYLEKTSQNLAREQAVATRALFELKDKLGLPEIPLRIECFDISNVQGTSPTGSMVVFENGKAKKSDYKRFAVKSIQTPNDVAMMREVLNRRFTHAGSAPTHLLASPALQRSGPARQVHRPIKGHATSDTTWRLPDLLIVDGGRAQLNTALRVLQDKQVKIPTIGLAKREEEIYIPKRTSTLKLLKSSPALQLLQRIRDEAHRFAITYHRKRRSKSMLS